VQNRATLTAAGGTATAGNVTFTVPAGAVAKDTQVTAAAATNYPQAPAGTQIVSGTATDLGPTGTAFAKPVRIAMQFDPNKLPTGALKSDLRLYLATAAGWQQVSSGVEIDTANNQISATVVHLSTYAIIVQGGGSVPKVDGTWVPVSLGTTSNVLVNCPGQNNGGNPFVACGAGDRYIVNPDGTFQAYTTHTPSSGGTRLRYVEGTWRIDSATKTLFVTVTRGADDTNGNGVFDPGEYITVSNPQEDPSGTLTFSSDGKTVTVTYPKDGFNRSDIWKKL